MSETDVDRDKIERLMKAVRLPGPSDALKTRVIEATQKAWRRDSIDIPVRILLRRLVTSATAAVIVIALADRYSDRAVPPWQPGDIAAAYGEPFELEVFLESPHSVAMPHRRVRGRQPAAIDASALRGHVERFRETLSETLGEAETRSSTPVEGRGRMIPTRPESDLYS